jgi:hypothetical protein
VVERRSRAGTHHRVHVDNARPQFLWAGKDRRGGRRGTASSLFLLPLVVDRVGAEPISNVGLGVRHRRGWGAMLIIALRRGRVENDGRRGVAFRGLQPAAPVGETCCEFHEGGELH